MELCAFAEHLRHAVAARPDDAIALGVFSTAGCNS